MKALRCAIPIAILSAWPLMAQTADDEPVPQLETPASGKRPVSQLHWTRRGADAAPVQRKYGIENYSPLAAAGGYGPRQAAYDLKKLRGKQLIERIGSSHRYRPSSTGVRAIAGLILLRDKVIKPLLAGCCRRKRGPKPKHANVIDAHYNRLQVDMQHLLADLGFGA